MLTNITAAFKQVPLVLFVCICFYFDDVYSLETAFANPPLIVFSQLNLLLFGVQVQQSPKKKILLRRRTGSLFSVYWRFWRLTCILLTGVKNKKTKNKQMELTSNAFRGRCQTRACLMENCKFILFDAVMVTIKFPVGLTKGQGF